MQPEKLLTILDPSSSEMEKGYGIHNINNRIKLNYGEMFGVTFSSEPEKGTEVGILLPAVLL